MTAVLPSDTLTSPGISLALTGIVNSERNAVFDPAVFDTAVFDTILPGHFSRVRTSSQLSSAGINLTLASTVTG